MEIEHLNLFVNLAETLNFSQTAQNCHISESSVSRIITRIEEEIGVKLFYRTRREVRLTSNGETFYHGIKSMINSYNKSVQQTRNTSSRENSNVTIGLTDTPFEENYMPEKIQQFCESYPDYKVFIEGHAHTRLKQLLVNHDCDVIMLTPDDISGRDDIEYHPIISGYFVGVVPKNSELADLELLTLDDIKGKSIIFMDSNWCPPAQLEMQEYFRKNATGLNMTYVNNVSIAMMMAESGLGIAVMPNFIAGHEHKFSKIIPLDYNAKTAYGPAIRKDEKNQAVLDFVKFLEE